MEDRVLFIDAAYDACSVGLRTPDGKFCSVHVPMKYGHAEALMPLIDGILKDNGITARELTAIAVNVGPGRFTGIRLAIAAAKSLALPYNTKLIGITGSSVYAFMAQRESKKRIISLIDSGRGNYFCRVYAPDGKPETDFEDLSPDAVKELYDRFAEKEECVFAGDAAEFGLSGNLLNAEDMDSYLKSISGAENDLFPVSPLYVRPPDVCMKNK